MVKTGSLFIASALLCLTFALGAEEPAGDPPPADAWKEGIVDEFPTQYESYIPGLEKKSAESLEIAPEQQVEVTENQPGQDAASEPESDFSFSEWFENRNVVNGLLLIGILILFVIYQMRSSGKRRG